MFQDFDQLSERRKALRRRKLQRRLTIAAIIVVVLIILVVAAVVTLVFKEKGADEDAAAATSKDVPAKILAHNKKLVKTMCSSTDYKRRCHRSLEKAVKNEPSSVEPRYLLKAGISAVNGEIKTAFNKTKSFKFESDQEKAAFEDCKLLMKDAIEESQDCIYVIGNSSTAMEVSGKVPDLNNWLSAIMSYQQTCIDGFEDGKLKRDMKVAYSGFKELTSNSLAMVSKFSSLRSLLQGALGGGGGGRGRGRHLLAGKPNRDEIPSWISVEQRRMLKGKHEDKLKPNVTVAKDGSGTFKTIYEALAKMPKKYKGRYVIYIKKGVYNEIINIPKKMQNVTMYGDGSKKTIITGNKNSADGVQTFRTATFAVMGNNFMAKSIGFRNTAGPKKHQAVAARVQADRAIFLHCRFEGYQNTLYAQTHRQYYRSCVVTGTIDFISGDAATIFHNCEIYLRKPLQNQKNTVTAQGRTDKHETTGIVLQACHIRPEKSLGSSEMRKVKSYLGRPMKDFARTVVMESTIEDVIEPEGWLSWEGEEHRNGTVYYAEYGNKGNGSKLEKRVRWPGFHKLTKDRASNFTIDTFLQADWVTAS